MLITLAAWHSLQADRSFGGRLEAAPSLGISSAGHMRHTPPQETLTVT